MSISSFECKIYNLFVVLILGKEGCLRSDVFESERYWNVSSEVLQDYKRLSNMNNKGERGGGQTGTIV